MIQLNRLQRLAALSVVSGPSTMYKYYPDTVYLTGRELAHRARAAAARDFVFFLHACSPRGARRAGLTVYTPLGDVAAASSQSCDRKSKIGLRHGIKLN
jgi:hypothetical protein